MINAEGKVFALYQMHADVASRQDGAGSWHLTRVRVDGSNLEVGVHDLSDATIVGLANQIPAEFESGYLIFTHRLESEKVITEVQSALGISQDDIVHALGSNKIILYSYSDPQM